MKKFLVLCVSLLMVQLSVFADNEKVIEFNKLPEAAQNFVMNNFRNRKVAVTKMEIEDLSKSYEVVFKNGDKIEFNGKGKWTEVSCKPGNLPLKIIPAPIKKYLAKHYPAVKVVEFSREKKEYEVVLANELELKFDQNFNLTDLDD